MASKNPTETTGDSPKAIIETISIEPEENIDQIKPLEMVTMDMSMENSRGLDKLLIQHCIFAQKQMNLGYFKDDDPAKVIGKPENKDHFMVVIEHAGKDMEITTNDGLAIPIRIAFNTINREVLLMTHHHKYIPRHFIKYHKFKLHNEVFQVSYFN